jgi:hypothetical protein
VRRGCKGYPLLDYGGNGAARTLAIQQFDNEAANATKFDGAETRRERPEEGGRVRSLRYRLRDSPRANLSDCQKRSAEQDWKHQARFVEGS